jgi:HK97 family phage prohead protease
MPYPNEHAARLRDPGDFDPDSFRRTKGGTIYGSKNVPETISIIWGKLKDANAPADAPLPQALRFPTSDWTEAQARKWLEDNEIEVIDFEPASEEERDFNTKDTKYMKEKKERDDVERRYLDISVRAALGEDKKPVIEGVAAVFNQETIIAGMFREVVRPGAFTTVLAKNPDVIGAPNHDWSTVLGRTTANTLHLVQMDDGLHYSIDINPDDQEAMNFYARVKRGDVHQSSYAWNVLPEGESWIFPDPQKLRAGDKNLLPLRELREISELYDVSPVTFPAYPTTSANVRSKLQEFDQIRSGERQEPQPGKTEHEQVQAHLKMLKKKLELADRR